MVKFGHSCVRFEGDAGVLVVDPGTLTEPEALDGADAILATHEHPDHFDADRVRTAVATNPATKVYGPKELAEKFTGMTPLTEGSALDVAGFSVTTHGGRHAVIHPDIPGLANLGYLINGVYHPGDSLAPPDHEVETLLVPVAAPWLKISEVVEFVRALRPARAHPINDAILSEAGRGPVDQVMGGLAGTDYSRLRTGDVSPATLAG